jgi:hypothetical protein
VTSLAELGRESGMAGVDDVLLTAFARKFGAVIPAEEELRGRFAP